MPEWKIKEINVRLEFAIQAPSYGNIIYDPYEAARSFPIAADRFEVLDPDKVTDDMLSKAVLGLQFMVTAGIRYYILYRCDDLITFAPETKPRQIALKITSITIDPADPQNRFEGTAYYPIRKNDEHLCSEISNNKPWSFLLLEEDGNSSEYRLIHIRQGGPGSGPGCIGCYAPYISLERWWECFLNGCY